MDQRYKVAATEVENIQKKHAKQIPDDVKAGLIGLISDLKKGAKSKKEVKTKFDTLERAIKTKKPDLWKLLEDIRNSLDIDSMGIVGTSNSSIQPEERARAESEMAFMVECFRAILEILQDNGNTSIFPKPAERLTEKVSEGYGYASKVASLCKEQKSELDHMSKIIEDLYNQAVEGNDDLKQGKPEKPTTTSSNKGSTDKGKSVPKKPDPSMTSAIELKSTAVSSALKKTKGDLKRASKVIEDLYTQAVEVNEDQVQRREKPTATGSKKGSEDKGQTVPKKTEPDIASDLETKGTAVTLALTKMKGGLEHASKIIEDLYNQAVEGTDDKVQRKRETSTPTSSKKGSTDKGQTVPKKPEPDIASTIDMKGIAVSSALKNTKGDLKRASKIIQDLYTQAVEVNEDQVQRKIEKPTATGSKKGSEDKGQTVPKKTEPDIASDLETKGTAVTLALTKMKGGLEHASKIIEDLYNQAVEGTDDRAQRKQETSTPTPTSSKKGSTDKGQTVPKKPEPDIASTIEMKGIAVLSALKNMKGLSEIAGSKTTHENASIAELSDPNRPTKLGEKYLELYNFQWTDAYRNISTKHPSYSDEKVIGSLYDILIDGYRFCQGARQTQKLSLEEILLYPAGGLEPISGNQKERPNEMFSGHLSEAAKVSSDLTRVNIVKAFVTNEQTKKKYGEIMKVCETFIDVCVQLCWQMQVQTPPVFLDLKTVKGQAFVSEIYKEYTRKGNKIAYVVWPALFLHENGPLLVKGFAQGE